MPTLTALTPTKRDPDRVTVKVDKRVVATISVRSVSDLALAVGQEVDEKLLERLAGTASIDKAMKQSLNRLGRRAMSSGQLDRKLSDLGYEAPTRAAAIERLTQVGLLDDVAFAEAMVREMQRGKPAGPRLLRQKMRQKHLDSNLIDRVLAESTDAERDAAAATELAQKRAKQISHLESHVIRRRVYGLLARRGFDPNAINHAMSQLRDDKPD